MAKSKLNQPEDYATAIGFALHAWSLVEYGLALLFDALSGISPARKGAAAFGTIKSFEVRIDVCHALMPFADLTGHDLRMWNLLYEELKKYYRKRHRLAHFTIVDITTVSRGKVSNSVTLVPFYPAKTQKDGSLSVREIDERAAMFSQLAEALKWFWLLVLSKQATPQGSRPPATGLVRQLHLKAAQHLAGKKRSPQSLPHSL